MKICYIGNTCNNSFHHVRTMRARGHDAVLYYETGLHPQTFPEWEDPSIAENRPKWLRPFSYNYSAPEAWQGAPPALMEEFSEFDVIHAEDRALIWASKTGKPYGWYPYGYDMLHYSFAGYGFEQHLLKYGQPLAPWYVTAPIRFRRAVAGAAFINNPLWMPSHSATHRLLQKLTLPERIRAIPVSVDTELFSPGEGPGMSALLREFGIDAPQPQSLTLFLPTRIIFAEGSGYNYGSDRLLRLLRKFADTGRKFTLIVVSKDSPDEPLFKELVGRLGLHDHVIWIPMQQRHNLVNWYRACDVVANEFGDGGFGSIAYEALSCGACLLTSWKVKAHSDPTFFLPEYASWPPHLSADTDEDALENLINCADDPHFRTERQMLGREWVLANISPNMTGEKFEQLYTDAIARHPVTIRKPVYDPPSPLRLRTIGLHLESNNLAAAFSGIGKALNDNPEDPLLLRIVLQLYNAVGGPDLGNALRCELDELGVDLL